MLHTSFTWDAQHEAYLLTSTMALAMDTVHVCFKMAGS